MDTVAFITYVIILATLAFAAYVIIYAVVAILWAVSAVDFRKVPNVK